MVQEGKQKLLINKCPSYLCNLVTPWTVPALPNGSSLKFLGFIQSLVEQLSFMLAPWSWNHILNLFSTGLISLGEFKGLKKKHKQKCVRAILNYETL